MAPPDASEPHRPTAVVVIGGGRSGLSAGYHLKRRGFAGATTSSLTT
jgi:cation diffusion facilitator CzcD-associated flavoprotein CzcO